LLSSEYRFSLTDGGIDISGLERGFYLLRVMDEVSQQVSFPKLAQLFVLSMESCFLLWQVKFTGLLCLCRPGIPGCIVFGKGCQFFVVKEMGVQWFVNRTSGGVRVTSLSVDTKD